MSWVRQGVNGVVCYLDDMLITGKISDEYLQNLEEAWKKLQICDCKANEV